MNVRVRGTWMIFALCIGATACSCRGPEPGAADGDANVGGVPIRAVDVSALPPVEGALPPLDGGRVEITPPAGWTVMSRSDQFVVRFAEGSGTSPPRILVTAEDLPGAFGTASKDDLKSLYDRVRQIVDGELRENEELREPIRILTFGDGIPWARYVRGGVFGAARRPVDRQIMRTIVNNRLYTLELQVFHGEILRYRDAAYATAANMKFLGGAPAGASSPDPAVDEETGTGSGGADEEG